jgi:hypothetical protein
MKEDETIEIVLLPREVTEGEPDDAMILEPFFRKREDTFRIQRLQTKAERKKFAKAFEAVGCVRCQTTSRAHQACGFCTVCYRWYKNVLNNAVRSLQND